MHGFCYYFFPFYPMNYNYHKYIIQPTKYKDNTTTIHPHMFHTDSAWIPHRICGLHGIHVESMMIPLVVVVDGHYIVVVVVVVGGGGCRCVVVIPIVGGGGGLPFRRRRCGCHLVVVVVTW
jgi:hypothetical protein